MRVVVTGATGFIGGHVARRLAAAGHEVVGTGRRETASTTDAGAYVQWDLGDPAAPPPAELHGADAVVHTAAHVADWGRESTFQRVTVDGTRRLIAACGGARLIVVGSASVYDPFRGHLAAREEEAPVDRYRSAYGRAKADQERLLERERPDALILRPHAVYGAGDRTLLPRLVAARRRGRLLLPGGGRQPMSVTHVDSLVDVIEAALAHPDARGPLNVADARPVRVADLLETAFTAMGKPTRIVRLPIPLAWTAAHAFETAYRVTRRDASPPLTTYTVSHLAWPFVLDLDRLEDRLGLRPDRHYADHVAELAVSG